MLEINLKYISFHSSQVNKENKIEQNRQKLQTIYRKHSKLSYPSKI